MAIIRIAVPGNRTLCGELVLYTDSDLLLWGPVPVAARTCSAIANEKRNPTRDPLSPYGDAPLGSYAVKETVSMAGAALTSVREFGRYDVLVLDAVAGDCLKAAQSSTRHFTIHGGALTPDGRLRATIDSSFRLSPENHFTLMKALDAEGGAVSTRVFVEPCQNARSGLDEVADDDCSLERQSLSLSRTSAMYATAAPFVLLRSAQAQGYCDPIYDSGASFSAVDFRHIMAAEGGSRLSGYVPHPRSGVIVGGGIDLSRFTRTELFDMGMEPGLISLLEPYIIHNDGSSPIGNDAIELLNQKPLSLTFEIALEISNMAYTYYANLVGSTFNAQTRLLRSAFSTLSVHRQTAPVSMYVADKNFLSSAAFRNMVAGNWQLAEKALLAYESTVTSLRERAKYESMYLAATPQY